ncbi:MAG: hypothetical protein ACJAS1_000198 [Oleiphilaceae bacterium]|jgi:hypothetical protein
MFIPKPKTVCSIGVLLSVSFLTACGGGSSSSSNPVDVTDTGGGGTTVTTTQAYVDANKELKGDYSANITLTTGQTYAIDGAVNFLDGATLTIPEGTTLYGESGSSFLAINRGAKIMADGTAAKPIIFTSAKDIAGTANQDDQGQWGGLSIFGKSTNNKGERTYEAGTQKYGPVDGVTTADDNSGILDYVIIKYSGFEVEKDKELNGLSLGSVGSETQISNIAIIGSADDGIEFWGGTVNVDNLFVYNAGDDSIDTDQGYTGTITNAWTQHVVVDDETGSRAIEADGFNETQAFDPAAPADQQVVSKPTLKNATLDSIGRAIRLREGTGYVFDNVQVNVKSSSANPSDTDYFDKIAAIRISDTPTFDTAEIAVETVNQGLAIRNEAVELTISASANGDLGPNGNIASGLGLFGDQATKDYFDGLSNVHTVVGISQKIIDDGLRDDSGSPFATVVAANNTVTGADKTQFSWILDQVSFAANSQTSVELKKELKGDFDSNITLTEGQTYAIDGEVNFLEGTRLTIPADVTMYGKTGSTFLAINRGAKIYAEGSATQPIVFTSAQDIAGTAGVDDQGQWGGLSIFGQSTNNKGERTYEAGTQKYGPKDGVTIADDNSGILRHVAVKFSGFEVEKDKELNGISLGSVGSGTTIENVAAIGSADDGIEMWGGTVNVNGLYIYNAGDDSLDTDQGYTGTMTNVFVEQNVVDDETGSRAIEADGFNETQAFDPAAPIDQQIVSKPVLKNAILKTVGRAIRLREGTGYVFDNVQVTIESATDTTSAVIRVSDTPTISGQQITTAGAGIAIKNKVNNAALYHNADTTTYFQNATLMPTVLEDDDTSLTITEYDRSWIPGWTK